MYTFTTIMFFTDISHEILFKKLEDIILSTEIVNKKNQFSNPTTGYETKLAK